MKLFTLFDRFLLGMVIVVALAAVWPGGGRNGGILHMDIIADYGISIVFYVYGVTLEPQKVIVGLAQWKVHIVTQTATFVLFPLIVFPLILLLSEYAPPAVLLGFAFLAALPSTISSSVAMTSFAHGSVPVAMFNATMSSILSVFVTPLLVAAFVHTSGGSMQFGTVVAKIAVLVLIPIGGGQLSRRWLLDWIMRNARVIKSTDRIVVLAIVYNAFCNSIQQGVWHNLSVATIAAIVLACVLLFFVIYGLVGFTCRTLKFSHADTIACLFCGSKKSLAAGVPLAPVLFGSIPQLGIVITPIIVYHFLQLLIVSVIASRFASRANLMQKVPS